MLRVNVGLSRKLARDYQSTGYSVNLDGEIVDPLENSQAILDAIDNLYRLAENALSREIDRDQAEATLRRAARIAFMSGSSAHGFLAMPLRGVVPGHGILHHDPTARWLIFSAS